MSGLLAVYGETFAYSFDIDQQHSKHHARHFLGFASSQSGLLHLDVCKVKAWVGSAHAWTVGCDHAHHSLSMT